MNSMFDRATSFNGDLSAWDVSEVTDMNAMFFRARSFNGDLSTWDVSKVNKMIYMFRGGTSFNGDLSAWDVSGVTDMGGMFHGATSFNGDLSAWDVSGVTDMGGMFHRAISFNQNLGAWYVVLDGDTMSSSTDSIGIAAQNRMLNDQNPTYTIDGAATNGDKFRIANGTHLALRADQTVAQGQYNVTIKSTGSFGVGNSRIVEITVGEDVVPQTNNPPSVEAGPAQAIPEGSEVRLNGSATDPDGDALTYLWSHNSTALDIRFENATAPITTLTAPQVDSDTALTITLTVTDDGNATATSSAIITITDIPATLTSESQQVSTVTLDPVGTPGPRDIGRITLTSDTPGVIEASWVTPSETPAGYRISWAQVGDPYLTWTDSTGNAFPADPSRTITGLEEGTEYKAKVRATYGGTSGDWSGEITIAVARSANNPPTADAGTAQTVQEGDTVTLSGTASDQDGDQLTYSWSHDSSLEIILTDADSLAPSFTAPQVHGNTTITFTLMADDGRENGTDTVQVTVLDEPANSPPSVDAGEPVAVREGAQVTLNATASDQDGDQLTYSWSHDSALDISLVNTDSLSPTFTAPQVSANTIVAFTLTADDGTDTHSDTVTVTILDVSDNLPDTIINPSLNNSVVLDPPEQRGPRDIGRITLTSDTPGVIEASWVTPSETPAGYRISWAQVGDPYLTWTDSTGNAFPTDPSRTITGLEEGTARQRCAPPTAAPPATGAAR